MNNNYDQNLRKNRNRKYFERKCQDKYLDQEKWTHLKMEKTIKQ